MYNLRLKHLKKKLTPTRHLGMDCAALRVEFRETLPIPSKVYGIMLYRILSRID